MLQLYRNNQVFTALLVFFYFLIFGANIWLYPNTNLTSFQELPSTLSQWLFTWLSHPLTNKLCFSVLLLLQAFVLNSIVNNFKLAKEYSFVPAICFVLLHFSYFNIDGCSPVLIANSFILWAVYSLFGSYEKRVSLGTIFNAGFSVAMATLFYHGYAVYSLWVVVGLLIIRSFDLQEFLILLAGYCIPFFLMGTYHFLDGNLAFWIQSELSVHYNTMEILYNANTDLYLLLGIMTIPTLLALGNLQGLYFKTTSREKKYIQVMLIMPVIGLFSFLLQSNIYSYHYLIFIVPSSVLLSLALLSYKSLAYAEAIHFLLFMLCLGIQYQLFFFQ